MEVEEGTSPLDGCACAFEECVYGGLRLLFTYFSINMKHLPIYVFIIVSLYAISTAEKQDFVKHTKNDYNIDNSEITPSSKETRERKSSKTDKKSSFHGAHITYGWHQRREQKRERQYQRIISNGRRACKIKRAVLYEAIDEFGNTVQIAPFIGDKGKVRQQIISETYCAKERCSCHGVNNGNYESTCETEYMMVYAIVIKAGKMTWSSVKARAGCSCIVREKHFSHIFQLIMTQKNWESN